MASSSNIILITLFLIGCFALGAFPFGYWIGKLYGIDLHEKGTGNAGIINIKKSISLSPAIFIAMVDIIKGWGVAILALKYFDVSYLMIGAVILTIFGDIFSPFSRFKGGDGVGVAVGSLYAIILGPMMVITIAWVALIYILQVAVLVNVLLGALVPLLLWLATESNVYLVLGFAIFITICLVHRKDISRLLEGEDLD